MSSSTACGSWALSLAYVTLVAGRVYWRLAFTFIVSGWHWCCENPATDLEEKRLWLGPHTSDISYLSNGTAMSEGKCLPFLIRKTETDLNIRTELLHIQQHILPRSTQMLSSILLPQWTRVPCPMVPTADISILAQGTDALHDICAILLVTCMHAHRRAFWNNARLIHCKSYGHIPVMWD